MTHLEIAGGMASDRGDVRAASSILQRALALTPAVTPARIPLLLRLAETSESAGRTDEARGAWQELDETFREISDPSLRAAIEIQRLDSIVDEGDRSEWAEEVEAAVGRATEIFGREDDRAGLARAHFLRGVSEWAAFRASSAGTEWARAAEHAHAAGETALKASGLSWVAATHLYGATHVDDAVRELEAIEREVAGSAAGEAAVAGILATCLAMGGREHEAREALGRALEGWREHGLEAYLADYGSQYIAWVERCAGDSAAELQAWLGGLDASRRLDRENRFLASLAAVLLAARGEIDEAGVMVAVAHPGDWAGNIHMRFALLQASAILDARAERDEDARRKVREVTDMMHDTEFLAVAGDAFLTSALVERLLGDEEASDAAADRAIELYRRKGAVALIARARAWQEERSAGVL